MKFINDILLNFNSAYYNVLEFYEWNEKDFFYQIDKIPIIKINSMQLQEIENNIIVVSDDLLVKINNKTRGNIGTIEYALLVCDCDKVLGLEFNKKGELIKRSCLIYEEEEKILDECSNMDLTILDYKIVEFTKKNIFIIRKDRKIRELLLDKLDSLYKNNNYDEINYLYYEIFNSKKSVSDEYNVLKNELENNYQKKYRKLYDIIKLVE